MEKVDKNESARSLALKFGCLKKLFAGFGGGGGGTIALNWVSEVECGKLYPNVKPKSCTQDLCLEKLMCHRARSNSCAIYVQSICQWAFMCVN